MKQRVLVLGVFALVLLLALAAGVSGAALPDTGQRATTVEAAGLSGGRYVLAAQPVPQTDTTAAVGLAGGQYRLAPASPSQASGCCCKSYLSCLIR